VRLNLLKLRRPEAAILALGLALALWAPPIRADLGYASSPAPEIDPEGLRALKTLLEETSTRAAVVVHDGQVVAEWYWRGEGPLSTFECWSTSKSIASTMIGLLIDEGRIEGVGDPVAKYVPSWDEGDKARVTLRHLLVQTSGLQEVAGFPMLPNQLEAAINAPLLTPPGEVGRYNNAGCNMIAAVVYGLGLDPEAYIREKLWKPLGMDRTSWRRDSAGNVITYAGVQVTAPDLARFGQFILDKGRWGDRQILSQRWIEEATRTQTHLSIGNIVAEVPYGYLWWLDFRPEDAPHNVSALGLFGNNLTIIPELRLVGVRLVGSDREGAGLMTRTPDWVAALARIVRRSTPADEAPSLTATQEVSP